MLTDRDAAEFFNSFSSTFDTLYDEQRGPVMRWFDRHFRSDMFLRFSRTFHTFGDLTGKSVLDIGCGSGPYVLEAFKRGAGLVTALDPAPGMLDLVSQRLERTGYSDRCVMVESLFPGEDLELEPHDHAIIMGVMDYVSDAGAFLKSLHPLIRESAAISFPSRHWLRTPIRKFRYDLRNCPLYFYDPPLIKRLAREAGFSRGNIHKIPGAGMDYHVVVKP